MQHTCYILRGLGFHPVMAVEEMRIVCNRPKKLVTHRGETKRSEKARYIGRDTQHNLCRLALAQVEKTLSLSGLVSSVWWRFEVTQPEATPQNFSGTRYRRSGSSAEKFMSLRHMTKTPFRQLARAMWTNCCVVNCAVVNRDSCSQSPETKTAEKFLPGGCALQNGRLALP